MNDFWSKVRVGRPDECWPFTAKSRTKNGYGIAWADFGAGAKTTTAHRVAFFVANGRPPAAGLDVMHACDNRICCNPAHLSEGTRRDNMRDCSAKGRTSRMPTIAGEKHHRALLTDRQVAEIKTSLLEGESYTSLGQRYGVRADVIGPIARGQTWKHVTPIPREESGHP